MFKKSKKLTKPNLDRFFLLLWILNKILNDYK